MPIYPLTPRLSDPLTHTHHSPPLPLPLNQRTRSSCAYHPLYPHSLPTHPLHPSTHLLILLIHPLIHPSHHPTHPLILHLCTPSPPHPSPTHPVSLADRAALSTAFASDTASSNAWLAPWPLNGDIWDAYECECVCVRVCVCVCVDAIMLVYARHVCPVIFIDKLC